MINRLVLIITLLVFSISVMAQQKDEIAMQPKKVVPAKKHKPSVYYGGELGVSFGSYFAISVRPLVGYNITPKFSMGLKVAYQYVSNSNYSTTQTSHNYGGSILARYRFIPQVYAHAEYAFYNFERFTYYPIRDEYKSYRVDVPFLLVGAGYLHKIGPNVALNLEVLFDILQSKDSPFSSTEPFVSFGVWVGI